MLQVGGMELQVQLRRALMDWVDYFLRRSNLNQMKTTAVEA